jgi:preprotein translocase subunit SecY
MILNYIKSIFAVKSLKNKIIATLLLVLVYKMLSVIPIPWANTDWLKAIIDGQKWLSLFSALMWGWLENFSIILMWLSPYINAVIIIQLLWVIIPKIWDMQKEWESGQRKINKMTRWLTLPLAFLQSYGMILLLNNLANWTIIDVMDLKVVIPAMLITTAWTIFLMWLWEVMTEYWIGNWISIIIMAWVLSWVPQVILSHISLWNYGLFTALLFATLVIIYIIIKFTEWNRRIPIIYTKTWREEKSYFPIRINQAWMIPIIFAISLVTFPWIVGQIMANSSAEQTKEIWTWLLRFFSLQNPSWVFIAVYFAFVLIFSFFYVSITFNTDQVAESIQKRGGYIPGIRPGSETADYLSKVSWHLNLFWGSFLALIAVLPYILQKLLPGQKVDFLISWAWLIILVSTILDLIRKIDSEMKMFDYSKYK